MCSSDLALPELEIIAKQEELLVIFPDKWLADHALTFADLQKEIKLLRTASYQLTIRQSNDTD